MIAVFVNMLTVIVGGLIGTFFGNRISEKYTKAIMTAISLITLIIGIQSAMSTSNILLVVVCLVLGTLIGTALKIDDALNSSGDFFKGKLQNTKFGKGSFAEAFVASSMLFCIGSMTIIGSIQAGLNKNYEIIFTKSIMDLVSSLAFSSALGAGVLLSVVTIFIVQGGITMLAVLVEPFLTTQVVAEMSAVSGAIFIGMAINLMGLREEKIKVGDMLPAIFLPILYFPLVNLVSSVF